MLKKILTAIILSAFLFVGNSFCSAEMPRKEMYLGGLTFGSPTAQMLRMYGNPRNTEGGIEYLYNCYYGKSVLIGYNAYANKIFKIVVKDNNGWNTPKGLAVGMTIDKALEMYGDADFLQNGDEKTVYAYFHKSGKQNDFGLIILVDNATEKILQMNLCGGNTMATFEEIFPDLVQNLIGETATEVEK